MPRGIIFLYLACACLFLSIAAEAVALLFGLQGLLLSVQALYLASLAFSTLFFLFFHGERLVLSNFPGIALNIALFFLLPLLALAALQFNPVSFIVSAVFLLLMLAMLTESGPFYPFYVLSLAAAAAGFFLR